jgi:general secretion pathway protein C
MFSRIPVLAAWPNHGPLIAQALAMLAMAAGIGVWSALLLAPQPTATRPLLASGPAPGQDISALINWFGGGNARVRIAVVGLLSSGQRGTALLSINGGPPKAYSVGHTLAQGVTLSAVLPHGVSIDQDGIIEDIRVLGRTSPPQGFLPAGAFRESGQ